MHRRTASLLAVLVVGSALLAGCVGQPNPGQSGDVGQVAAPSNTPTPDPTLVPGGTAEDNEAFFRHTIAGIFAAAGRSDGISVVNTLAAAGFDKSAMEVSYDTTPTGLQADTISVSVKVGDQCLVGQLFASTWAAQVQPVLATGRCFVATTRPIDW